MYPSSITLLVLLTAAFGSFASRDVAPHPNTFNRSVSLQLFLELEELARLVDISYCVGNTGIHKPFECLSRCKDFDGFELVEVRPTPVCDT
jgi:hypothetical protein